MSDELRGGLDARLLRFRHQPSWQGAAALASALLDSERVVDALEVVESALALRPDDPELLLVEGKARLRAGDLARAQAALVRAARLAPEDKEAFRWLGELLLRRGDPHRAVKILARARQLDPDSRAIALLAERAARLARLADDMGTDGRIASARKAFERPAASADEEHTTVAQAGLLGRLADSTREPVEREGADRAVVARQDSSGDEAFAEPTFDEEAPTRIVSRELFESAPAPRAGDAAAARSPAARVDRAPVAQSIQDAPNPTPAAVVPASVEAQRVAEGRGGGFPAGEPARRPPAIDVRPTGDPRSASAFAGEDVPTEERPAPNEAREARAAGKAEPAIGDTIRDIPSRTAGSGVSAGDRPIKRTLLFGASPPPAPRPPAPRPAAPPASSAPFIESAGAPASPAVAAAAPSPRHAEVRADVSATLESRGRGPGGSPDSAEPVRPASGGPGAPRPLGAATVGGVGVAPSAIEPPSSPDARAVVSNDSVEGDVPIGKDAGRADDVEDVLAVLRRAGLLETSERSEFVWAGRADVERPAMRLGRLLLVLWVVAALAAAGGWFGWQHWLRVRREQAATLRDRAASAALAGDHADLIAAERWLREARELDPHAEHGARWMLVVHAQRALEDGAFEAGFLRPSLSRAERAGVAEPLRLAARAVVAVADADPTGAARHVEAAVAAAGNDPWVLYVAGRLGQRIGVPGSVDRIAQAAEREPRLSAAAIALAEARADEGQRDEALASIANVLNHHRGHLRASLWKAFLEADEAEPRTVHDALDAIARRIADHGAPTDRVLAELVRARLARREGQLDVATEAIDRAARAGASEPRLLALVASEARAVGRLSVARAAASAAVQNAPAIAEFRKLLAEILLDERDGTRALRVLGSLSMDDPDVLRLSARAALVVGAAEPIQAAAEALTRWLADHPSDATVELRSLRVRALVDLGRVSEVLQEARTLAREAPGDPDALRALGEAALAVRDARLASETLARLVSSLPDDPDAHFLHGRALRLSADADGAERALRRALELAPGHVPARLALGRLLLDRGKWAEADAVYVELTRSGARTASGPAAVAGRLGRVEALIGLGRLDDAEVQMGAVREQDRDTVSARLVVAALALARRRPGEAVAALRDVAAAHTATADVVAAYGDALYEAGETDAAAAAYDRALELDGTLPEALLGRARIAVRAERPRDAYRYLDEAEAALRSRIRPPRLRATLLTLRGRAALLEGRARRELARSALRAAVQLDGVPAEAHFFLGEALSADNSPEARAAYEAYLAREPDGPFAARARRAIEVRP